MQLFFGGFLKGKNILEIGVGGEGGLILQLKTQNHVIGLDLSISAQRNCKELGLDIQLLNLDKTDIPLDDQSLDLILAFEVFEHFANPQHAIEEIKRVLKPTGELLVSLPNPHIHHWPRLFYPELFYPAAFEDFLRINHFVPVQKEGSGVHRYHRHFQTTFEGAWHMLWKAQKIRDTDAATLFDQGKYFWNQKDMHGIRIKPIEAIDYFRKASHIPDHFEAQLALTCALLYRYVNGEVEEFETNWNLLVEKVEHSEQDSQRSMALYYFALTWIEMRRLQIELIPYEQFEVAMRRLCADQKNAAFVESVHAEFDSGPVSTV